MDMPVGTGFSYSQTQEGYHSSDTLWVEHTYDFLQKVNNIMYNVIYDVWQTLNWHPKLLLVLKHRLIVINGTRSLPFKFRETMQINYVYMLVLLLMICN